MMKGTAITQGTSNGCRAFVCSMIADTRPTRVWSDTRVSLVSWIVPCQV